MLSATRLLRRNLAVAPRSILRTGTVGLHTTEQSQATHASPDLFPDQPKKTTMAQSSASPSPSPLSKLSGEYVFPKGTLHFALTKDAARVDLPRYREALDEHGILSVQLGFSDPESKFMSEIASAMGNPITHSDTEGALWDIKLKPEGVRSSKSEGTNGKAAATARSHTMDEFTWHTDASYEDNPPRFFGFHIIQPDFLGGGLFRVLPVSNILASLDPKDVITLRTYDYTVRVPPEFHRGKDTTTTRLIDDQLDSDPTRNDLIRYRGEIIEEPIEEHAAARRALQNLSNILSNPDVGFAVPRSAFRENSVLLMDNARFLHSRTPILDPRRWLRRIRFHPN